MKKSILLTFSMWCILMLRITAAQQINRAEYFFDSDPGVGNATQITFTAADSVDISGNISIAGLQPGFHTLYIRARYGSGVGNRMWSMYEARRFYVYAPGTLPQSAQLTSAEYFIDTDPGVGNGTAIATGAPADSISKSSSISLTGLTPGFHNLYVRVKDADNRWSMYEPRSFYIVAPVTTTSYQITAAEYFIDTDPGVGAANAIATGAAADSVDVSKSFALGSLSPGFHRLGVRVKNANGKWSMYEVRNFFVSDTSVSAGNQSAQIVRAEYFYDSDPGQGNGTAVPTAFSPADSVQVTSTGVTNTLSVGTHYLFVRVQDQLGRWSIPVADTLSIGHVGLNDNKAEELSIYPNPASSSVMIHYTGAKNGELLVIRDVTGRIVIAERLNGLNDQLTVDVRSLSAGSYFWSLEHQGQQTANGKLMVAR